MGLGQILYYVSPLPSPHSFDCTGSKDVESSPVLVVYGRKMRAAEHLWHPGENQDYPDVVLSYAYSNKTPKPSFGWSG